MKKKCFFPTKHFERERDNEREREKSFVHGFCFEKEELGHTFMYTTTTRSLCVCVCIIYICVCVLFFFLLSFFLSFFWVKKDERMEETNWMNLERSVSSRLEMKKIRWPNGKPKGVSSPHVGAEHPFSLYLFHVP